MNDELIIDEINIMDGSALIGQNIDDIQKRYGIEVFSGDIGRGGHCPGGIGYVPLEAGNSLDVRGYPDKIEVLKKDAGVF